MGKAKQSDIKPETKPQSSFNKFKNRFTLHSSGFSDKQGNSDSRGDSSAEKGERNLFKRQFLDFFSKQKQADSDGYSSLNGSELIVDAYSKAIIFGPVRATLEQFDQKVNDLIKQGGEVLTKANSIGGDPMGEGETLDNRIKFAARLKTECDAHKQKLLDMEKCIYDASRESFSTISEMDIYYEFRSIINETDNHILKQRVIQNFGGEDNVWQHINQSKIKLREKVDSLIEKVDSQVETLNASITEMDKALQKAANDHRKLERPLEESQAACKILEQRLAEGIKKQRATQPTFDAAEATFKRLAREVNELVEQNKQSHWRVDRLELSRFQYAMIGEEDPLAPQINFTTRSIVDLGDELKELHKMQTSIISEKDKLYSIDSPVEDSDRLQTIINRIDGNTLKQERVQKLVQDVHKQNGIWQQSKVGLIKKVESQIETLKTSITKTKEAQQIAENYYRQFTESQAAYKTLQQRLAEGTTKLKANQAAAEATFKRFAREVNALVNQVNMLHVKADRRGSDLLEDDTTNKGEPLGNQINSTAMLINKLESGQTNLHDRQQSIVRAKEQLPPIDSIIEGFNELQSIIKRTDNDALNQAVERDFCKYNEIHQQSDQTRLKLRGEADSQIEIINVSLEKTKKALEKATNYLHQLKESQEPYSTLRQQLAERQEELNTKNAVLDAAEATCEQFAPTVKDLERRNMLERYDILEYWNIRGHWNMLEYWNVLEPRNIEENMADELVSSIRAHPDALTRNVETISDQKINATITQLEGRMEKLREIQKSIVDRKGELSPTTFPIDDYDKLRGESQKIVAEIVMHNVLQNIDKQFFIHKRYNKNKKAFIEKADSHIKTINTSIEKTEQALQIVRDYRRQLEASQAADNV